MPNDRPRRATAALIAAAVGLLAGGIACGDRANPGDQRQQIYEFPVTVELSDTEGNPVAEAPVQFDDRVVGYTDKNGQFKGVIRDKPGTEIRLALGELDGYRYVDGASRTEVLELKPSLSGEGRKGVEVLLHAEAESLKRHYLIWLKATCQGDALSEEDCRGLTVERDGEPVTTTDRFGTAHVSLRERAGKTIAVSIESPTLEEEDGPDIEPKTPTYRFETDLESTVYLLEPTFRVPEDEDDAGDERRQPTRRPRPTSSTPSTESSGGGRSARSSSDESDSTSSSSSGGGSSDSSGDESNGASDGDSSDENGGDESDDGPVLEPTERTDSDDGDVVIESSDDSDSAAGAEESGAESGSSGEKPDGPIDLFDD